MHNTSRRVLVLTGPTSSGKTSVACAISKVSDRLVVVNADSKQVYRELPILTSQASCGMLYGYLSVFDDFVPSVASWMRDCASCLQSIWAQKGVPLIVGGTPMYVYSLMHGISLLPSLPDSLLQDLSVELNSLGPSGFLERFVSKAGRDLSEFSCDSYKMVRDVAYFLYTGKTIQELYRESSVYKIPYDCIDVISVVPSDRDSLYSKINKRFLEAVNSGAIDEVASVIENEAVHKNRAVTTICGFREIASYLRSEITFEHMVAMSQQSIRNYAKRQLTWFRNKFSGIKVFNQPQDAERYILMEILS
ncbi:tRNA (adenosine(37)-N6)-dimethylallyltransferase [Neorickettsia findlayensis]|uniref:tRNA dimethylallyltransferase n=1 Tax=Neorickettsia findlayensis TaxID=2686014 RepID=A0A6P1GA97_9RICK|nr:tRNA dimethylallyltransferase [Neorickettsia findlayensis]QHD65275.1 tRNA dimethylallyltransferase [Neorickettsia findlayensis]